MTTIRKNYYEELIDNMMINEVSGMDNDIRETLEGLSVDKKRMAILSILDKDRDMFVKIKKLVSENNVTKTEHIKNVVSMLRDYVEVGSREQKQYGEVFTKYWTINEMLDLIPSEDWSNPNLKFLDSCAGVGNFPAIIIERLMEGLKDVIIDQEVRYKHIVENMLYMVELQSKNAFLLLCGVDPKDEYEINIYNGSFLSEGFDDHMKNVWGVENFTYIIQNPPYQEMDGGNGASAKPLYHEFIKKGLIVSDKLISIHPSRWMGGGKGLDNFRKEMFNRVDIRVIKHWDDSQEVFGKCVDIRGGIQYLLIDKDYDGLVNYNGNLVDLTKFDVFIDFKYHSLIGKLNNFNKMDRICRTSSTYPIRTNDQRLENEKINDGYINCYVSKAKGFIKYVDIKHITRNIETIGEYKVITARAAGKGGDGFGNTFIGLPNEICTDSYISFKVNSKEEAESLVSYMKTNFCNFFLSLRKITQDIKPDTCKWIPLVPFDREWTDETLFEFFQLTEEEKQLILIK